MIGEKYMKSDLVTGRRSEINAEDDDTSIFMYVFTFLFGLRDI